MAVTRLSDAPKTGTSCVVEETGGGAEAACGLPMADGDGANATGLCAGTAARPGRCAVADEAGLPLAAADTAVGAAAIVGAVVAGVRVAPDGWAAVEHATHSGSSTAVPRPLRGAAMNRECLTYTSWAWPNRSQV
jgi:hypothetical protein